MKAEDIEQQQEEGLEQLPSEMALAVMRYLSFQDLCNLKLTKKSHAFFANIELNERLAIVGNYAFALSTYKSFFGQSPTLKFLTKKEGKIVSLYDIGLSDEEAMIQKKNIKDLNKASSPGEIKKAILSFPIQGQAAKQLFQLANKFTDEKIVKLMEQSAHDISDDLVQKGVVQKNDDIEHPLPLKPSINESTRQQDKEPQQQTKRCIVQ
jgi:hypothetical protein